MRYVIDQLSSFKTITSLFLLLVTFKLVRSIVKRSGARLPQLKGPPSTSFFFGRLLEISNSSDRAGLYSRWESEYGPVFQVPVELGRRRVMLCDPKAIEHFFSKDTFTYFRTPSFRVFLEEFVSMYAFVCWVHSKSLSQQRRSLGPAFSGAALRVAADVFFDITHKVEENWNAQFELGDEIVIDIGKWFDAITLDSIGICGFGYDFKSVEGRDSPVNDVFSHLNEGTSNDARTLIDIISPMFPLIFRIPMRTVRMLRMLNKATSEFAAELIKNSRKEGDCSDNIKDRSILGELVKGRSEGVDLKKMHQEVVSQVMFFCLQDTSLQAVSSERRHHCNVFDEDRAVSIKWAVIELARHPEMQRKLREELRQLPIGDPTYDQLTSRLPYLDAVVRESLRLHPVVHDVYRVANEDDIIPLDAPIETASGQMIDSIIIPKGTPVCASLVFLNCDEKTWGSDSKEFRPERWLENPHRKLFSFGDGQRLCLGKALALAELKAVLSVFIRHFSFELMNGPDTELGLHFSILVHPKMVGERGARLPMRVKRVAE
ncbi:cytochrome P450 [Amanita rubescens]|nr:cytochrome P450 [Amanita rubescens]